MNQYGLFHKIIHIVCLSNYENLNKQQSVWHNKYHLRIISLSHRLWSLFPHLSVVKRNQGWWDDAWLLSCLNSRSLLGYSEPCSTIRHSNPTPPPPGDCVQAGKKPSWSTERSLVPKHLLGFFLPGNRKIVIFDKASHAVSNVISTPNYPQAVQKPRRCIGARQVVSKSTRPPHPAQNCPRAAKKLSGCILRNSAFR